MSDTNSALLDCISLASLGINLNTTLGAGLIGLIVNSILFGVTCVQTLKYHQSPINDPWYLRWAVSTLWLLDAIHLVFISRTAYSYFVINFTDVHGVVNLYWSTSIFTVSAVSWLHQPSGKSRLTWFKAISDLIIRSYYTRQVWMVSKKNRHPLTVGLAVVSLVNFASVMAFGIKALSFDSTLQFHRISYLIYMGTVSAAIADILLATSLCYFLAKNKTGFETTDTKINVLMKYAISSGLFTSIAALATLITYATMPDNYIFVAVFFNLPTLYFNSLLALLNTRDRLRDSSTRNTNNGTVGGGAYQMRRVAFNVDKNARAHSSSFDDTGVARSHPANENVIFKKKADELCIKDAQVTVVNAQKDGEHHKD
ncbi:hypothetical protein M0805_002660 [Coniferiporia weirii]|nr:hypothetical protein M0805_002660 [Coniferiporia weirii]